MILSIQAFLVGSWQSIVLVIAFYFLAWLIYRVRQRLAVSLMELSYLTLPAQKLKTERQNTLQELIGGTITFIAFIGATIISFSLFINVETLIWVVGLFSAAFGLGLRPLVSDFFTGISFLFENPFEVGEKVEMAGVPGGNVEGVIEAVHLRTTNVRSPLGDLYTIPNGEIRVVRNFSRGLFSSANIKLTIEADDITHALSVLERLGYEAPILLPNLLEPWQIISESGEIGHHVQLTLVTKARFGKAAEMRPRLLALVQERLERAKVTLSD